MERLSGARELLDGPLDERDLAGNMRDLVRVNRWLGGARLSHRALEFVRAREPTLDAMRLLDVGTGAGDIPHALLAGASRAGWRLEIVATDIRPEIVAIARQRTEGVAGMHVTLDDAQLTAHPDRSFDVVHASLVLHHLDPPVAVSLLAQLGHICRHAVIVNELARDRRWLVAGWLLSRALTGNRYTRHDAPLSIRRAYQPDELSALAAPAGLTEVARFRAFPGHRYALVLVPRG